MAPSLCGSLVTSKRSLLALGWTITSLLSVAAFITASLYAVQIKTHYNYLADSYSNGDDDDYYGNRDCREGEGGEGGEGEGEGEEGERCDSHDSRDEQHDASYYYSDLASVSSGSMTFAGIYTASLAVALSLYGSLAIVGFSSVRGQYIAPCLGGGGTAIQSRIHLGVFMGALVLFSNLCLVCAVIFGEFRVEDHLNEEIKEELESYAAERISRVLAVLCLFLSVLYFSYAVLLFAFKDDMIDDLTLTGDEKEMELGGSMHRRGTIRGRGAEDTTESMAGAGQLGYEPPMGKNIHQDENGFITTQATESY